MKILSIPGLAAVAALAAVNPVAAATIACSPSTHGPADPAIRAALTGTEPGENPSLRTAISEARRKGADNASIVDQAVSAYCSLVASDPHLSASEQRERVRRFASELTTFVYDPGQAEDDIIVSLPVPTALFGEIGIAASKAGESRDSWIKAAIETKLGRR